MILTVTLNPAVDCLMGVSDYHENAVNRADYQQLTAGGKGINISVPICENLNINNVYATDIKSKPNILLLGFNPLVFCNTNFL